MTLRPDTDRTFTVDALARVEGEGAMHVVIRDGRTQLVQLRIYEPPRFFEAFLRGRAYTEPPDITARICGICPIAYQMSACNALEAACGITVDGVLGDLRRLLYCGEWIESHTLHIYLLPHVLGVTAIFVGASVAGQLLLGLLIALVIQRAVARKLHGAVLVRSVVLSAWVIRGC